MSRTDVAESLRTLADSVEQGPDITLRAGEQSVTLASPSEVGFEVTAEREGPVDGDGGLSIEVELEWPENAPADGTFSME